MKRQTLISLNIMIASIIVFVFMLQVKKTTANDANFIKALLLQSNHQSSRVTTDATPTVFTEGMENSLPIESLVIPATPEQLKKNETIIKGARALIKQAEAAYRLTGWWHSSFQNYLIPSNFEEAKLPNGLSMPTEWKEDHWMLIDKDGYVIKEVNIQDTGSPETSQIGTFKDSIMTNITFGVTWDQEPYIAPFDGGMLANLETEKIVTVLETKEGMLDGIPVIIYMSTTTSVKPVEIHKGYWVAGGLVIYYFSKDTGLLLLFEHYDILADGQKQLTQRIATLMFEKIKGPPTDVIKYLK